MKLFSLVSICDEDGKTTERLKKFTFLHLLYVKGVFASACVKRRGVRKEQQNELCDLNHLACFDSDRIPFTSFRQNPVYSRVGNSLTEKKKIYESNNNYCNMESEDVNLM